MAIESVEHELNIPTYCKSLFISVSNKLNMMDHEEVICMKEQVQTLLDCIENSKLDTAGIQSNFAINLLHELKFKLESAEH